MFITPENLQNAGFLRDEDNPHIYSLDNSGLDFMLSEGTLSVGLDLIGDEDTQQIFFNINSKEKLDVFLSSVNFDFLPINLPDHAKS